MSLLDNPVFLLLVILVLGELLGVVRLGPFSLGSSAILLVAIAFCFGGYELPSFIQTLGLTLFIYSIGLQAGPGFLSSLRNTGLRLSLGAAAMVLLAFVSCLAVCVVMGYGPASAQGCLPGPWCSWRRSAPALERLWDPRSRPGAWASWSPARW